MNFFHSKHQCYIVGEGSFIGHCGNIPDVAESGDEDPGVTSSIKKSKSLFSLTSLSDHQLQVTADVEPTEDERASSIKPSLRLKQELKTEQTSASFDDGTSTSLSPPKYQKLLTGDEVVSEDGK